MAFLTKVLRKHKKNPYLNFQVKLVIFFLFLRRKGVPYQLQVCTIFLEYVVKYIKKYTGYFVKVRLTQNPTLVKIQFITMSSSKYIDRGKLIEILKSSYIWKTVLIPNKVNDLFERRHNLLRVITKKDQSFMITFTAFVRYYVLLRSS